MPARLDLSARVASQHPAVVTAVTWGGALPALPPSLRDEVRAAWGIDIASSPDAPDPLAHPAFAALFARTRAEQIVLALSSRTNLVLAGTTTLVAGDGPLAAQLTSVLGRIGARVIRLSDDPLTRLRAHLDGLEIAPLADPPRAHHVIATGEHAPLGRIGGAVLMDAAPSAGSFSSAVSPEQVRPHVHRDPTGDVRVVDAPLPFPEDAAGTGLQWRLADALVALSLLSAAGVADPDTRLAELVLS